MINRRLLSTLPLLSRASHVCMRSTCKVCLARATMQSIRGLATKQAFKPEREFKLSAMEKCIQAEIEHNRKEIQRNDWQVDKVLSEYNKLISSSNIQIENEAGEVVMTIPKEGYKFIIRFDAALVAQTLNSQAMPEVNEEEEEDGDEYSEEQEDMDNYDDEAGALQLTLEVKRDNVPNKWLSLSLEASPKFEGEGYDVYVMDVAVERSEDAKKNINDDSSFYVGPTFDSLDDSIREKFDEMAQKTVAKLVPLIADYARASEANLYQTWLEDVNTIVAE